MVVVFLLRLKISGKSRNRDKINVAMAITIRIILSIGTVDKYAATELPTVKLCKVSLGNFENIKNPFFGIGIAVIYLYFQSQKFQDISHLLAPLAET